MSTVLLVAYGSALAALTWLAVHARRAALRKSTVDTELTCYDAAYLRGGEHPAEEAVLATDARDRKRAALAALPLLALAVLGMFAVPIPLALLPITVFALACRPSGSATRAGARLEEETRLDHPVALHGFAHFPNESLRLYAQELRPARVPQLRPTVRPMGTKRSSRDVHTCSTGGGGGYSACGSGGGGGD